jgi:diguanylate cyclase (GGDEF)-like protein
VADDSPVQIADDVWWVGMRLENDVFQCHAYLIENGDESVLLDPGSPLTIAATMDKVRQITPVDSIRYLVCHHPDPDIAAGLRDLSVMLGRDDVLVVTEWRAQALLKHYGHRFGYYRVEDHDWKVPLTATRDLEFQLTPYLHFPGAMVSYDTGTRTLFSSDLFGGFVPDSAVLEADDIDYVIDNAKPFHQHYMPSTELLSAGLARIQHRWPEIDWIAPQHGHVIPGPLVEPAFAALSTIACGVFTLADADVDLQRLLHLSQAKEQITQALLTVAEPISLVAAINTILKSTHEARDCALFIDLPDQGWTMWGLGNSRPVRRQPPPDWPTVNLPGEPAAVLALHMVDDTSPDEDLLEMLTGLAPTIRPAVDQYLHDYRQARRVSDLRKAALTDPLTGLPNRRALDQNIPLGDYSVIALDLDHFKLVNDHFGHSSGDAVLVQVASALQAGMRGDDAVYRVGGEEFLAVLPHTPLPDAIRVAERLRLEVKAIDFTGQAPDGRMTLSLGVTGVTDGDQAAFTEAVERADEALYESKENGRDRVTSLVLERPAGG